MGNSPVPVNSSHKGQWRGALMFSLICVWINGWVNNREAGDLRRHHGHYDVKVMMAIVTSESFNNVKLTASNVHSDDQAVTMTAFKFQYFILHNTENSTRDISHLLSQQLSSFKYIIWLMLVPIAFVQKMDWDLLIKNALASGNISSSNGLVLSGNKCWSLLPGSHCWNFYPGTLSSLASQRNRPVSQMRAILVACRELAVDYYTFAKLLYVFGHKM